MLTECEYDPDNLIDEIGDRSFSIVIDENLSTLERKLYDAVIVDCEYETKIMINSGMGKEDGMKIAEAMLKLLNQEYTYTTRDES